MNDEARSFFEKVTDGLKAAGVAWERNARLVRGLDYYRHTAFEFVTDRLGAQGTVLGGGRYDGLIENLGGPATPAVGWAAGIERLGMLLDVAPETALDVVVAVETDDVLAQAVTAIGVLRRAGLSLDTVASGSPRKRYDKASKIAARALVSVNLKDGRPVFNAKGELAEQVQALLSPLFP